MVALGMGCVTRHRGRHGAGVMDNPRCPSPIAAAGPRMGLGSLGTFGAQGIPTDVALHMSLRLFNRGHADPVGRESAARSGSPPVPQSHPVSPGTEAGGCREGARRRAGGARAVGREHGAGKWDICPSAASRHRDQCTPGTTQGWGDHGTERGATAVFGGQEHP